MALRINTTDWTAEQQAVLREIEYQLDLHGSDIQSNFEGNHTHLLADTTDITATVAEVNILDGVVGVIAAEISYLAAVTSDIQAQIDGKETADAAIVKSDEAETISASWTFTGDVILDDILKSAANLNFKVNTSENAIVATANAAVDLYYNALKRFSTMDAGVVRVAADGNLNTDVAKLSLGSLAGTELGWFGFNGVAEQLEIANLYWGGLVTIESDSDAGAARMLALGDPEGSWDTYYQGVVTAKTMTVATGGLEVNQSVTAAAFERVMTETDNRETGTWDPTYTGFGTDPTGDLRWQIISQSAGDDGFVVICDDALAAHTGTSDAATFTITDIPTAIRPDGTVVTSTFEGISAGYAGQVSRATVSAAGVITFETGTIVSGFFAIHSNRWVNTTTAKGLAAGAMLIYPLKSIS